MIPRSRFRRHPFIRIKIYWLGVLFLAIAIAFWGGTTVFARTAINSRNCTYKGLPLYGEVQVVQAFPDLKVQAVTSFPDLNVQAVENFPNQCGQWKFVDIFPDLKIQFVRAFPDLKVQFVNSFPGIP